MGLELGESDVSPEAVDRQGDSLIVTAAIAPGEKQLTLEYLLPAGHQVLELPLTEAVPMLNVLAEETDVVVSGGTLVFADSQTLQGRSFRRWTGTGPAGGRRSHRASRTPSSSGVDRCRPRRCRCDRAGGCRRRGWRPGGRPTRASTDELLERAREISTRATRVARARCLPTSGVSIDRSVLD